MVLVRILALLIACAVFAFGGIIPGGNFDDVSTLSALGWVAVNNSTVGGSNTWFQGDSGFFAAYAGGPDSYLAANFNAAPFGGDISLWMLTPVITFSPGGSISFATRTETGSPVPDRLEVRLSTNGSSVDVGATTLSTGDFTTLLGSVNPTVATSGYPEVWTVYSFAISVGVDTPGRVGFRYFVPDTSTNANIIGIDSVAVDSGVPEPGTLAGVALTSAAMLCAIVRRRSAR